jgi:inhibitor of cysteine peptidase
MRTLAVGTALLALLFGPPGCAGSGAGGSRSGVLRLGAGDNGLTFVLSPGDLVDIRLEANPSTGYDWQVIELDESVLRKAGGRFEPESALLGAPGVTVSRFEAVRSGSARLRMVYARPWEAEYETEGVFEVRLIVE